MLVPLLIGVAAVLAGSAVPAVRARSRRQAYRASRATAVAAYERLGFCVETLVTGSDRAAARALADAAERWNTTGALLASARTAEECQVAGEVAAEGLASIARACRLLGVPEPRA